MRTKLIYVFGAVALVIASATAYRLVTGRCPLACLMGHEAKTQAPSTTN